MSLVKKCRHGRGLKGRQRERAWRECDCTWYADLRIEGVRSLTRLGADRREAEIRHARMVADRLAGRVAPAPAPERRGSYRDSVAALVERYIDYRASDLRPGSIRRYRKELAGPIMDFFASLPVASLRAADVEDFGRSLVEDAKFTRNYARGIYRLVTAALRWGVDRGEVRRDALPERSPWPKRASVEPRKQPSIEEVERVVAAMREPYRSMGELALLTGLRRGELLGLEWRDVDLASGSLRVERQVNEDGVGPPKTARSRRTVKLDDDAVDVLRRLHRPDAEGRIFQFGHAAARKAIRQATIATLGEDARVGWHTLRHVNAAYRNEAGQSLRDAAAALGHGPHFAMTMAYGWAAEEQSPPRIGDIRRRVLTES